MTSSARNLGTTMFAGLAIPVGGVSGIGTVGSLLALIFSSTSRTTGLFLFFPTAASVFAPRSASLHHCRRKVSTSFSTSSNGNRSAWIRSTCSASPALPMSSSIEGNGGSRSATAPECSKYWPDARSSEVFATCPFRRLFSSQGVMSHGKESGY
jgi:hypothetical protein